jgi:hypothetical protein
MAQADAQLPATAWARTPADPAARARRDRLARGGARGRPDADAPGARVDRRGDAPRVSFRGDAAARGPAAPFDRPARSSRRGP